jgi:hypothetical protein
MDVINDLLERKWTLGVIGLILGIVLGVVYAWVINPVEWVNGEPSNLRKDLQADYLRMVIDSYGVNQDADLATTRYENLGSDRGDLLADVGKEPGEVDAGDIQKFQALVAVESPTEEGEEAADEERVGVTASKFILPALIVTLVLGALLAAAVIWRRRMEAPTVDFETEPGVIAEELEGEPEVIEPAVQPLATFRTTYALGDDIYDDSFSIESASGDFLGECGVGIGEVIGLDEPKKVSAFEVWLFDKNDIQTVTKVLMSKYAFNDEEARTRLAAKGDPVMAESGGVVTLETASLRVDVRVVDINYGEGPLPPESFFDRLTVELQAWQTETGM